MKRLVLVGSLALTACAPVPTKSPTAARMQLLETQRAQGRAMHQFPVRRAPATLRSNRDIARDFLDLSFQMESGHAIARMSRFEGPISVRLVGATSHQTRVDLQRLIDRLRNEAHLPISLTTAPDASITIESVPRSELRRAVPSAACFVVPTVSSWSQYLAMRHTGGLDWKTLQRRTHAAVFVPSDAAPQEIRDCLHEELAQALGPLNDMYRLPDSVFNDDNMHAVLTGFDILILRTYYAPELSNGMTRGEVAARLPGILARLNPAGQGRPSDLDGDTPREWISAIETALGDRAGVAARRDAAARAQNLARAYGWRGARHGFAHYIYGRLYVRSHPDLALEAFTRADAAFAERTETQLHRAFVAVQLASYALANGDADQVMALTQTNIPIARRYENASLLATLMMFQAEALEIQGRAVEAQTVRLDSLGWARYGFGSEDLIQARLRDIARLSPLR